MLNGFWKLTWVETKVFVREPMGLVGTLLVPLVVFVLLGRSGGVDAAGAGTAAAGAAVDQAPFNVPILAALVIAVGAVISLVAIMSIYREGGILKRLRATPLSPVTILGAHVVVKLVFTILTLGVLVLAGRRIVPGALDVNLLSFSGAVLLSTLSILSLGFVIASIVPTARFAQPISAAVLYPMIAFSGLFFPLEQLSRPLELLARTLPTTHAVSLMEGIWAGSGWSLTDVASLIAVLVVCTALSARVFRWE
jgi:ABC-2 type transport system permease protein